jgi:ABC-type dipeptide/oligopeptide/nickel transport system permease subunit
MIAFGAIWHFVAPPGAAILIFVAGLLLFFGLRGLRT